MRNQKVFCPHILSGVFIFLLPLYLFSQDTLHANQKYLEAQLAVDNNELETVLELFQQAAEAYQIELGEINQPSARCFYEAGEACSRKRKYEKSRIFIEKSLEICRQLNPKVYHLEGLVLKRLGAVQTWLKNFEKSEQASFSALACFKRIYDDNHILIAEVYNNLGILYRKKYEYDKALFYYRKSLKIKKSQPKPDPRQIIISLHNLSFVYLDLVKNDSSILVLEEAVDLIKRSPKLSLRVRSTPINSLAVRYNEMGKVDEAINLHREALELIEKSSDNNARIYKAEHTYNLGLCYHELGLWNIAKSKYEESLKMFEELELEGATLQIQNSIGTILIEQNHWLQAVDYYLAFLPRAKAFFKEEIGLAYFYKNLTHALHKSDQFEDALNAIEEARSLMTKKWPNGHPEIGKTWISQGNIYVDQNQLDSAYSCYVKASNYWEGSPEKRALSTANIGTVLKRKQDWKTARTQYQQALLIRKNQNLHANVHIPLDYRNISETYAGQKLWEKALIYNDSALNYIHNVSYTPHDPLFTSELISCLGQRGWLFFQRYQNDKSLTDLKSSWKFYQKTIETISLQQKNPSIWKTVSSLQEEYFQYYKQAIDVCWHLYQTKKDQNIAIAAFEISELSKAQTLLKAIQFSKALESKDIPDALRKKEISLRVKKASLEKQLHVLEQKKESNQQTILKDSIKLALLSEKAKINKALHLIETSILEANPYYNNLVNTIEKELFNELQFQIDENQSVLEYYFADSLTIFAFVLNRDRIVFKKFEFSRSIVEVVENFKFGIDGYYTHTYKPAPLFDKTLKIYQESGSQLYNLLIKPLSSYLKNKVLIIPDDLLQSIPFEAFLTEKPEEEALSQYKYWIRDKTVQYAYSGKMWLEMNNKEDTKVEAGDILAFAPSFKNIKWIQQKYPDANFLSGQQASKNNLLSQIDQYKIIYIATHAFANYIYGEQSGFYTSNKNDAIYARDIYARRIPARLVILSACEASIGEFRRGEGLISLAHSFTYAGTANLIATLWKVDNESTSLLMENVYDLLWDKKMIDSSLRKAKISFIENGKETAHPFFWAGVLTIGNCAPIF